jgi:hypothetical protein
MRAAASIKAGVGECLRKVPQVPPCLWVELLGIEAEGRGDPEQPLHQVTGSLHLSHDREPDTSQNEQIKNVPESPSSVSSVR